MTSLAALKPWAGKNFRGHRLINAKYPPIHLFDDVASSEEFDALFEIQTMTNPRIQTELGRLNLIPREEIPFGIKGCSYAAASFTHVNPNGSRFSDGQYGLFYIAETIDTAVAEVKYHQGNYWSQVPQLRYDRFVFKELICTFNVTHGLDASQLDLDDPIYHPQDYTASRSLGWEIKQKGEHSGLRYTSVRKPPHVCYALFTPKEITALIQAKHYEMVWDGKQIASVNVIANNLH